MKRAVLFTPLAVLFLLPPGGRADEPAAVKLLFVRELNKKGLPDLALEYLEKLQQQKGLPKELTDKLPVELARTRVRLARLQPARQSALFAQARKELQAFVATYKGPELTEARVELARLAAQQGQALLSQSIRTEDDKAAGDLARQAEGYFQQAGAELKAAADALPNPADRIQVLFERGKNFLDQARTLPPKENRKIAVLIDEGRKALEEVEKNAKSSDPALYLARAWLIKLSQEGDAPDKAAAYYKQVMSEDSPQAAEGQRWAQYFHLHFIPKDLKIKATPLAKVKMQQKAAQAWLKTYARYRNTPEGYAVRFDLAKALLQEAQSLSKDPNSPKAAKLYAQAHKELAELAAAENDYTERATQMNLDLSFQKMGTKTPVDKLQDFEQCYLKARYEMSRVQEVAAQMGKADPEMAKQLEEKRRQHLRTAIAAFRRALWLADAKTSFSKLTDARFFLTYIYLMADDPYRAAILGEDLARARPPTKRSATAAGYALQAYNTIATGTKRPGDLQRMIDLAHFILDQARTAWKDEPVTQVARYQLAVAAILEKKPVEAVALLEGLSPSYPAYIYAQAQLILTGVAALRRDRETDDPKEKLAPKDRALLQTKVNAALERLPKLPDDADTTTAQYYFAAQLQKGNALYHDAFELSRQGKAAEALKKYALLDSFQASLKQTYDKHARRLPEEAQGEFNAALKRMQNLARYGIVFGEYRAGHYDAVLAPKAAGEVVEAVRKAAGKGVEPIQVADAKLTGEILGLAMRADVQKGKINEAKEILGLLRRLRGDEKEGAGEQAGAILQTLVLELKAQVRELKDKGQKQQLEATVKNFSQFLEELAREPGRTPSRESILFLASSYASLDKYAEAAKLYAQVPEPKIDPKKKELTKEEERALQDYWLAQVAYGRALRLGKQYAEARKVLARVMTDPKARGRFLAEKEEIQLLEDEGLYGKAVGRWVKYQQHPQMLQQLKTIGSKDTAEQRRIKELYYDCVYHYTYCMYMYGQKNAKLSAAKRDDYTKRAAAKVIQMKDNADAWDVIGRRFEALLQREPPLMAEYKRLQDKGAASK